MHPHQISLLSTLTSTQSTCDRRDTEGRADITMPRSSSSPAHSDGVMLWAMQGLPRSGDLRNGTLADWKAISGYLNIMNNCICSDQAPDNALRNKDAWSKAVDKCITAVLEGYSSAVQAAISRPDKALLSPIGNSLAYCLCVTHSCLLGCPAWLRLQERPHGLQRIVEALVSVTQRLAASVHVYENAVLIGLTASIGLNADSSESQTGTRLGEGLLVDLHCAHMKVISRCAGHGTRGEEINGLFNGRKFHTGNYGFTAVQQAQSISC